MYSEIDPEADEIAYSLVPLALRVLVGGIALFFLGGCFFLIWAVFYGGFENTGVTMSPATASIYLVVGFALSGWLFWNAGPKDITLYPGRCAYRLRQGLPLFARWKSGRVNDIAGIYIQRQVSKEDEFYLLNIDWRIPGRRDTSLGMFSDGTRALRHAKRLGERLDVDVSETIRGKSVDDKAQNARGLAAAAAILGGMSLLVLTMSVPAILQERALDERGKTSVGVITEVTSRSNKGRRYLYYDYPVSGSKQSGRSRVYLSDSQAPRVGESLPVTYLPDNPKIHRIPLSNGARGDYMGLFLAIITLLFSAGLLMTSARSWWCSRL
jgi:hypothetical protein